MISADTGCLKENLPRGIGTDNVRSARERAKERVTDRVSQGRLRYQSDDDAISILKRIFF